MIHVILDTNIFRHDPTHSKPPFKALIKLIEAKQIRLHIPHIVEREFQTQQRNNYEKSVSKAINSMRGLIRQPLLLGILGDLQSTYEDLVSKKDDLLDFAETEFSSWLDELDANRIPMTLDHTNKAFNAYFSGTDPYREVKFRGDIPDGFIVEGIREAVIDVGHIHLVANDGGVSRTFDDDAAVEVYRDLEVFVSSELIQGMLTQIDILENLPMMFSAIESLEKRTNRIKNAILENIGEQILWKNLHGPGIPGNDGQAVVNGYGDVLKINVDYDSLFYFGDGEFSLSFDLEMFLGLSFYLDNVDYYSSQDREPNLFSLIEFGDHSVEVEQEFQATVSGDVSLKLNMKNLNMERLDESVIQKVQIEEVQEITILED